MRQDAATMTTRDIPRSEWRSFFDDFSRVHESWLVQLEEIGRPAGPTAVAARGLPLMGLSYDPGDDTVTVALGGGDDAHVTRIISRPSRVEVQQTDGIDRAVVVEPRSGPATRVSFRSVMRPEEVDGVA